MGRALAWQKDSKQDPKFSTTVSVVNVLATVRDKNGKLIHDLTQADFTLVEDDHPQVIRYFSQQSDLPLTLGLLVDTSLSQRRVLDRERNASIEFLEHVLREDKDKAFVIHFDREVELLQDLTSSRKELEDAIHDLGTGRPDLVRRTPGSNPTQQGSPQDSPQGGGGQGQGRSRAGTGTALYDSVLLASDEIMRKQQGRKASILLSDGIDYQSKVSIGSAIEAAQRADMLVYSIWIADPDGGGGGFQGQRGPQIGLGGGGIGIGGRRGGGRGPGGGGYPQQQQRNPNEGKKILQRISTETGGAYFEVTNKMPLDKIYDRIEEDLRNQYNLGYTPDPPSGGYRRIHLTVKQKGLVVQTREGYYPAS
jgi:VWFA-related protein